ncbi:hypothetical protein PPACK8108_LOCUS13216 [Phakopsora pachyrhizi]|uniref:Uncharacterized protein n=1 Tax=Phakopsora pachyrhizi TaxID=170000 RepID=A0AAV0B5E2_PHAPC|nr:hypothetical protein PPACK8108_LOCUS13216 [Phakopsora pachyrhizi]
MKQFACKLQAGQGWAGWLAEEGHSFSNCSLGQHCRGPGPIGDEEQQRLPIVACYGAKFFARELHVTNTEAEETWDEGVRNDRGCLLITALDSAPLAPSSTTLSHFLQVRAILIISIIVIIDLELMGFGGRIDTESLIDSRLGFFHDGSDLESLDVEELRNLSISIRVVTLGEMITCTGAESKNLSTSEVCECVFGR